MKNIKSKVCISCEKEKSMNDFYKAKSKRDGCTNKCKKCIIKSRKDYSKQYYKNIPKGKYYIKKNNPHKYDLPSSDKNYQRERMLRVNFGITSKEYNEMFLKQNGRCYICEKHQSEFKKTLAVDHNHKTGAVRGLLCGSCNRGIGLFGDNIDLLLKSIEYLKIFKNK